MKNQIVINDSFSDCDGCGASHREDVVIKQFYNRVYSRYESFNICTLCDREASHAALMRLHQMMQHCGLENK